MVVGMDGKLLGTSGTPFSRIFIRLRFGVAGWGRRSAGHPPPHVASSGVPVPAVGQNSLHCITDQPCGRYAAGQVFGHGSRSLTSIWPVDLL